MILRCTKKLLTVVGTQRLATPAPKPDPEDWYANLLWIDRRKCLLLTHTATLFTAFEPNVTASVLRATGALTSRLIERELRDEQLPPHTFVDTGAEELVLAPTADRQVLGCMNDLAFTCEHLIDRSGGLDRTDLRDLNRHLHRTIYSARGYRPAIELVTILR
ncbi:hypothetical protein HLB23_24355 [Nocardia uniformis]|uniref:DUF6933 domain-containing protein n=1 Tax=Nocardia uniformis TaxID=53432 RepID=A0A849C2I8_9NOCA|nr:hypothetical protein [Nocardia uniformis]NNH72953.1 hypothetical protein [Nocardia uniformis]